MNFISTIACLFSAFLNHDDAPPGTVTVRMPDGKPATGAKVWAYRRPDYTLEPSEPPVFQTDANGSVVVFKEKESTLEHWVFAQDDAGRVGMGWLNPAWKPEDKSKSVVIALIDNTPRKGQLRDAEGKPIVGAVLTPTQYHAKGREQNDTGPSMTIYPPAWVQKGMSATSDSAGQFSLPIPKGYEADFRIEAPGYATTKWKAEIGADLKITIGKSGSVVLKGPVELKGQKVNLTSIALTKSKTPSVVLQNNYERTFDERGLATFDNIFSMEYSTYFLTDPLIPFVYSKMETVVVQPGKTIEINVKHSPAAKVTGQLIAADTGKGLAGIKVAIYVTSPGSQVAQHVLNVQSDRDGNYVAFGPAGAYHVNQFEPPNGYALPIRNKNFNYVAPAKVEAGQSHAFDPISFPIAVTFLAHIVDDNGKPIADAVVYSTDFLPSKNSKTTQSDQEGNLSIPNLPPDDSIVPHIRLGKAVNVPETFVLEQTTHRVKIVLSESNAAAFKGRITDTTGKPIAKAEVKLYQNINGVGRQANSGTSRIHNTTSTDAQGEYQFQSLWPKDQYWITVSATGYTSLIENWNLGRHGEAGKVITIADVKLVRAGLAVRGVVLGPNGSPLGGVELFSTDSPERIQTKSAPDGSFTLKGFEEHAGLLFAIQTGYQLTSVVVQPKSTERITITLSVDDGKPVPLPDLSKDILAAHDRLLRYNLTKLWENREDLNSGASAINGMAKLDLALARKWVEEEKLRSEGKTNYTPYIERAQFEKSIEAMDRIDIDDVIAFFASRKPDRNYDDAIRLAKQFLPTDKVKTLRFIEEAVLNARKRDHHWKVIGLAIAGDLAVQAGETNGKKLIHEAAELAEKLNVEENGLTALAVGYAAAYLAPHDAKKADALLSRLTSAGDYNRYTGLMAKVVARNDLPNAKKLLERMKPERSNMPNIAIAMIAYEIVPTKPDEAEKLIESIKDVTDRTRAMAQLALTFAKTDRPRAIRLIDRSFNLVANEPSAFGSYSFYGGDAAYGALVANAAKEVGHPNVPSLITRTLAMRNANRMDHSSSERDKNTVLLASAIALIDPDTAKKLLLTIAPVDEYTMKAATQSREWLFALALADPDGAIKLLDKIYERIKVNRSNRSALSGSGLYELNVILSSPYRAQELAAFGDTMRPLEGND